MVKLTLKHIAYIVGGICLFFFLNKLIFSGLVSRYKGYVQDSQRLLDMENFDFNVINYVCYKPTPILLIAISSAAGNIQKRQTIRETWAAADEFVKYVFMVGVTDDDSLNKFVVEEAKIYKDLVQGNFKDTYRNTTYKHVMALKYMVYHCDGVKYLLKTDDDVFVNTWGFNNYIRNDLMGKYEKNVLQCVPQYKSPVARDTKEKWYVSKEEYPNDHFPTYCPGWFILYSSDIVKHLYEKAQKNQGRFLWIDDVYITGILTQDLEDIHRDLKPLMLPYKLIEDMVYNTVSDEIPPFLFGPADLIPEEIKKVYEYSLLNEDEISYAKYLQWMK